VARAVISDPKRRAVYEPLYDIDPQTGTSIEVFCVNRVLAESFGTRGAGWFWWTCQRDCLPECMPTGPFANSYLAYRDFATPGNALVRNVNADTVRTRHFSRSDATAKSLIFMVGGRGIEPLTPSMSRKCSSAELTAQKACKA
jgi:hypothetical protein